MSRRCPDVIRAAFGQRPSSVRTTPHPAPTDPSDIQKSLVLYRFYKHFQAGLDGVQTASREAIRRGQGGVWAASEWRPGGVLVASRRLPSATRTPLARAPGCPWKPSVLFAKCLENQFKNHTFVNHTGIAWRRMGRRPATARMPPGHRADVARTLPERRSNAARTLPGRRLDAPLGAARTPSAPAAKCL